LLKPHRQFLTRYRAKKKEGREEKRKRAPFDRGVKNEGRGMKSVSQREGFVNGNWSSDAAFRRFGEENLQRRDQSRGGGLRRNRTRRKGEEVTTPRTSGRTELSENIRGDGPT